MVRNLEKKTKKKLIGKKGQKSFFSSCLSLKKTTYLGRSQRVELVLKISKKNRCKLIP